MSGLEDDKPLKPSEASDLSKFDKFASVVADTVSRAWFFAICVAIILVWAPTFIFFSFDIYQLIINTVTTIITFLLVALLQNTQSRDFKSMHRKLNAISEAVIDLMEANAPSDPTVNDDIRELREAVGLEQREGT